jgi:hypothetical protein
MNEVLVHAPGAVELREKIDHGDAGVEGCVPLETLKDFPSENLLAGLGDEPVIEEYRQSLLANPSGTDFGLPEPRLEPFPVLLVRRFDIGP